MRTPTTSTVFGSCTRFTALLAALLTGIAAPTVHAQRDNGLEEIIVTATKRSESLQDVPISIGVVGGETIEKYDIRDLTDLQGFVPGLNVTSTFGNWAVRIRGLGSGQTNLAFDSSVSIFKDGVYCGRSRCLEQGFLDVERVEVARGPQGALFGKSTIAGAISVMSARPTEEVEGFIRAGYESEHGGYTTSAAISGPITERLRARLAAKFSDLDGYVKNPITGRDEPESEFFAIRGSAEWDVNDSMTAFLKVEHSDSRTDGRSNQLVSPGLFGGLTADAGAEFRKNGTRRVSTGQGEEDYDDTQSTSVTVSLEADVGEHSLTLIGSHWGFEYENLLDVDGVPEPFLNTKLFEEYDQTFAEARLLSPTGQTFEYIVGAMFQRTDMKTRQYSPFGFFPAVVAPIPPGSDRNFERDVTTVSVYGQLTWNVSERFRIITDVRYTDEEQDGVGFSFPVVFPDGLNPVREPTAFNQPPEYRFTQTRTDTSIDPSVRFQFDVNDNITVYAAYATGSKPGGLKANDPELGRILLAQDSAFLSRYAGQAAVTPADLINGVALREGNGVFDFEDEEADNIELGAKMSFADNRATLNISLFQMKFDNLQTSSYDGVRFIIGNAASANISGMELEGTWQATDRLRLSGALSVLDNEYDDFLGAQCIVASADGTFADPTCIDGEEDLSGEKLERTPDWEANFAADYSQPLNDNLWMNANLAVYYNDGYDVRQDYHPLGRQDSFTKVDLRLSLMNAADTWEVAVVGRNLGDEEVLQHAYEIAGSNFVSFARGRTMTVEGTWRF